MKQIYLTLLIAAFAQRLIAADAEKLFPLYSSRTETPVEEVPSAQVVIAQGEIKLDGKLLEAAWYKGQAAKSFWQYFPQDSIRAQYKTEIYFLYDETHLYVGVKCFTPAKKYVVPSLRRDFRAGGNDNLSLIFDTFNDGTNAFLFGINPYGVQREALISNGGATLDNFDESWDNKWSSAASIDSLGWYAEFAIPFTTLRYKEGSKKWRFNAYRFDTEVNERSTWTRIPRNQLIFNLAFMGELEWDKPLGKAGANISLIPYLAGGYERDAEAGKEGSSQFDLGGDAKIGITSGLNLDLTLNPDFSQVEVDQQVTNLNRFEIFFPERRQFFLENADLFGGFGSPITRPFFSRRIGIAQDTSTGQNIQNAIPLGMRLSGKLGEKLRVGLLNMQAASDEANGLPGFNFTVAALQRRMFSRSNLAFVFVNKENFSSNKELSFAPNYFHRILGLDYNLASRTNIWTGKLFYHQAITPEKLQSAFVQGGRLTYNPKKVLLEGVYEWVGKNYDAPVGFVPRNDYLRVAPTAQLFFYSNKGLFNQYGPGIMVEWITNPALGNTDRLIEGYFDMELKDNSVLRLGIRNEYTLLFDDFDPTQSDAIPLPEGTEYNYTYFAMMLRSDRRRKLSLDLMGRAGGFFNGVRYGADGILSYRIQPYGVIALNYSYNYVELPKPYATENLFLIGPRIDLTFTRNLFWTTFLQYNSQLDNINLNTRLQWRFKPASDFFLVYTDNYNSEVFKVKNRALIAKLTYWINI